MRDWRRTPKSLAGHKPLKLWSQDLLTAEPGQLQSPQRIDVLSVKLLSTLFDTGAPAMWHMCNSLKVRFTAGQVLFSWGLGLAVKQAVTVQKGKAATRGAASFLSGTVPEVPVKKDALGPEFLQKKGKSASRERPGTGHTHFSGGLTFLSCPVLQPCPGFPEKPSRGSRGTGACRAPGAPQLPRRGCRPGCNWCMVPGSILKAGNHVHATAWEACYACARSSGGTRCTPAILEADLLFDQQDHKERYRNRGAPERECQVRLGKAYLKSWQLP